MSSVELSSFISQVKTAIENQKLVKLTLSKNNKSSDLLNVYGKVVSIKKELMLSLTYRFKTRDEVKNFKISELETTLTAFLPDSFRQGLLITETEELTLAYSKKFNASLRSMSATRPPVTVLEHDVQKNKSISLQEQFLYELGVSTDKGELIPKMADKYRQINKYIEVIASHLKQIDTTKRLNIVDMGSGKGYLTFALYQYLKNEGVDCLVKGVELREGLVDKCNSIADKCGFDGLEFIMKSIEDFEPNEIDVLIALHACDTATDDAIASGIKSDAQLIVCAPCCHKQVRKAIDFKKSSNPILKHGVFIERSCEMLTDTIRALLLESKGFKPKVFEFISNEYTRKNVMITAVNTGVKKDVANDVKELKAQYGLDKHYLEDALV